MLLHHCSFSLSASNCDIPSLIIGTMCKPKYLVSSTNSATLLNSLSYNVEAPSILMDSSLTALVISGLECFVRNNNVPTPNLYKTCSFSVTLSSSSTTFCPTNPGEPCVHVLHNLLISSSNIFSRLLIMVGCPNHAFSPFLLLITCTPK